MPEVVTGVAIKVGLEVFSRVSPKGFAWVKSKLVGRDLLIVGQPRAGKTSLVRYLQYGVFADPQTERTRTIKESASFTVKMGRDEALKLEIRKAVDTVGQVSAAEHAKLVQAYRPHVLVLVLDMTGAWDGQNEHSTRYYLDEFFDYFGDAYKSSYSVRRKLKGVFLVLNKRDRVTDRKAETWIKKIKQQLQSKLSPALGAKSRHVVIMESSLVEEFDKGKSANLIVQKIALTLEEG